MKTTPTRSVPVLLALCGFILLGCPDDGAGLPSGLVDAVAADILQEDVEPADIAALDDGGTAPDASDDATTAEVGDVSETDSDAAEDAIDTEASDIMEADADTTDVPSADVVDDFGSTDAEADGEPADADTVDADPTDVIEADALSEDASVTDTAEADTAEADTAEADTAEADTAEADTAEADTADDADTCLTGIARGAWFYRHPGSPLGSDAIVGAPGSELSTITNLQALLVTTIFGNYSDRPSSDTAAIAAWNAQLDAAGIESQLLIGDAADIFPGCREAMLEEVQTRLIDFNAIVAADERFDALHLDIEPQQYDVGSAFPTTTSCGLRIMDWPFWDDLDPSGRAQRYEMLLSTLIDVRSYLDDNGHTTTQVYADLAPWIDSSSSFDWNATPDIADGGDWLSQAAGVLDGITFMTYERGSVALIDSAVSMESLLPTQVRVSVSAKERSPLSSTTTWADLNAMFDVVEAIEATHCGARPVDLFNYRYLNE